jgi:hypothetical protein
VQKYKIMRRSLLVFLFIPLLLNAQLFEDFSDGDFTQNPAWSGTAEKYIVNSSFQLQLNASEAGTAWLSTPYNNPGGNVEWRFWIRLNFAPSGSNYSDVFLASDQADLSGPLNGYYLRFGEAGSLDAIELFKRQGAQNTSICRGTNGLIAAAFAIHIKVVRTTEGQWTIYADQTGSGIYTIEASGSDNTFNPGGHFGFLGQFTISNSTRMYYDNIFINQEIIDNEPPQLISATATDPFSIRLIFNEAISAGNLLNVANYSIDQEIGNPASVAQGATAAQAVLQLAAPLDNGRIYNLSISNIEDLAGNIMPQTNVQISYYEAQPNDVVINEIMADPSPVVGLPEWEFIELYNNSDIPINLNNWKLLIGTGERVIGSIQIAARGFVILAHENARPSLESFGSFFGFSSFQLANSGASLSLISDKGILISTVSYTDAWYNDAKKKDGGWTLEQKDPTNPCGGRNNWTASNHPGGGTPGQVNSVFAVSDARPKPETMKLVSENIIQIWFDQQMDQVSLGNSSAYTLSPGNINPQSAETNPADPTFVELIFAEPFAMGTIYELKISPSVLNCAGRPVLEGTALSFGIPFPVEPNDIVINEILFNPYNNGNDFVEIYNRSTKIINLEDLRLGAVRQTIPNPPDTTLRDIISSTKLIMPGTYMLLTVSSAMVTNFYFSPSTDNFVEMAQFPVYPNESGTAILVSKAGQVIDAFSYHEKMHFPLLNYVKGVSLERISVDRPSADVNNWHSAAETAGFATPGYQNSVFVKDETSEGELTVDPEIFSPDGDGRDDVTSIRYSFEEAGYTLNIQIFNASGQKVRHLVKSTLVSQEGAVSWDGLDESGRKVPTGIYVVYAEVFNLAGTVKGFKRAVVVGTR